MGLFTSRRASSDTRALVALFAVLIGTPLVALGVLQTNYTLAYWACADRSNAWLHWPNAAALAAAAVLGVVGWRTMTGVRDRAMPREFLSVVALLLWAMCALLLIAFVVPPLLLHPCD
jgi:hypothetical protein